MTDENMLVGTEQRGQSLGNIDRAMLPARASNGDGEIAAVVVDETRQPSGDEGADVLHHAGDIGLRLEIRDHFRIEAVQRTRRS